MGKVPDIHTTRAANLFNVDPSEVTPAQRHYAKMRNYFDAYGQLGKLEEYKHVSRTSIERQSFQEAFRNNLG
jgi:DNA polymerase I-like protein with 3'-5' exonuclease and polymerase domains